jgi:hypothetical protein
VRNQGITGVVTLTTRGGIGFIDLARDGALDPVM